MKWQVHYCFKIQGASPYFEEGRKMEPYKKNSYYPSEYLYPTPLTE